MKHTDLLTDEERSLCGEYHDFTLPPPQTFVTIKNSLQTTQFIDYLEEFDKVAADESLVLVTLPAAVVKERYRAQTMARDIEVEDEEKQHKKTLENIELLRKRRLCEINNNVINQHSKHRQNIEEINIKTGLTIKLLSAFFHHTQRQLALHLTSRHAEIVQTIGEVQKFNRGDYHSDNPDCSYEHPVEVNVQMVRGVKNKIPKGEYIMLVSKWDKMSGNPMRWSTRSYNDRHAPPCPLHQDVKNLAVRSSCEVCQGWAGATIPVVHSGVPTAYEMNFNSCAFTCFPSHRRIKPYMALMFELMKLPEGRRGTPVTVGWGVMPCIDSTYQIINGKFRFPLLRGEYRPSFMLYHTIADVISNDIENWLGNCYIEVTPHHRGQDEFTAKLLGLDENLYPVKFDGSNDLVMEHGQHRGISLRNYEPNNINKGGLIEDGTLGNTVCLTTGTSLFDTKRKHKRGGIISSESDERDITILREFEIDRSFPYCSPETWELDNTAVMPYWSMARHAVQHRTHTKKAIMMEHHYPLAHEKEVRKAYRFSVNPDDTIPLYSMKSIRLQVEYCVFAIFDQLYTVNGFRHYKFWLNVVVFFISLILLLYAHGCVKYVIVRFLIPLYSGGNWIGRSLPPSSVDTQMTVYGLLVDYSLLKATALEECSIVFLTQFGLCVIVLLIVIGIGAFLKATGLVPGYFSKFVYCLAVAHVVLPWLMIIIDSITNNYQGDILRLWEYFEVHKYGVYYSVMMFELTYLFYTSILCIIVFQFTMRLHLNGIIQDAYWRIVVLNDESFIPEDLEVSRRELLYILDHAERWRGKNGERRKVCVHHMITTDEDFPDYESLNQYIVLKQFNCGNSENFLHAIKMNPKDRIGSRMSEYVSTYRQFYVLSNGAILETFNSSKGVTDATD